MSQTLSGRPTSRIGEIVHNWKASLRPGDVVVHIMLALFFAAFLTDLDMNLRYREWLPVSRLVVFGACMAAILVYLISSIDRPWNVLSGHVLSVWRQHKPFLLAFAALAILSLVQWIRRPDAQPIDASTVVIPLCVCAAAAFLPLAAQTRRGWRAYLWAAFLLYYLTVWVDALVPGTFSISDSRPAGLAVDYNAGAYMALLLATPLLAYRRYSAVSLITLWLVGLTVFLTLSRGGILIYLLLTLCHMGFVFWRTPGKRLLVVLSYGSMLILLAFSAWLSTQSLEYFQLPDAQSRLNLVLGQRSWIRVGSEDDVLEDIQSRQQRYLEFGRVVDGADPDARERISDIRNGALASVDSARVVRLKNGLEAVAASPITGHGTGFSSDNLISPHNMYLLAWIDLGILGVVLYAALLAAGFWIFYRIEAWHGMFLIGVVASWSMFSHTMFDHRPLYVMLGLLLALPVAAARERKTAGRPRPAEMPAPSTQRKGTIRESG